MIAITTSNSISVKPSDTRKPDAMGAGLGLRVVGVLPIKLLSLYGSSLTRNNSEGLAKGSTSEPAPSADRVIS